MPPWLIRLLDQHAVPYVDLRLHPVRFLDDLLFAARASVLETQAALLPMAVHENEVFATAGLREAMCRFISEARVPDNTLLVAGQRRFDSTQIIDGTFFDAMPRAAEIHAICARYPAVVLKPHRLDRHHSLLEVAAGAPGRMLGVIDDNIYRMMALPQISAVLTVNSGLAYEAAYFGKHVHALAPLPDPSGVARGGAGCRVPCIGLTMWCLNSGFLARGVGVACPRSARRGRRSATAEAEPVAHCVGQFLEFSGDRHRPHPSVRWIGVPDRP